MNCRILSYFSSLYHRKDCKLIRVFRRLSFRGFGMRKLVNFFSKWRQRRSIPWMKLCSRFNFKEHFFPFSLVVFVGANCLPVSHVCFIWPSRGGQGKLTKAFKKPLASRQTVLNLSFSRLGLLGLCGIFWFRVSLLCLASAALRFRKMFHWPWVTFRSSLWKERESNKNAEHLMWSTTSRSLRMSR